MGLIGRIPKFGWRDSGYLFECSLKSCLRVKSTFKGNSGHGKLVQVCLLNFFFKCRYPEFINELVKCFMKMLVENGRNCFLGDTRIFCDQRKGKIRIEV